MSKNWNVSSKLKSVMGLCVLILAVFVTENVLAEEVVFEDVSFLYGSQGKNNSFTITAPGTYQATLVDFDFPSSFDTLSMNITKGATSEVERMNAPGSLVFDATPGLYFANVFGTADSGHSVNASLYGLKIAQMSVSAVPLPTAIGMFVSALLLYVGFGSAGTRVTEMNDQGRLSGDALASI